MDARTSRRQKKISARQEQRIAEDMGGRVQPASGALPGAKSDVRVFGVARVEAKYTSKDSYKLTLPTLDKIISEAGLDRAVLQVSFVERSGKAIVDIAVIPWRPRGITLHTSSAMYQSFGKSMLLQRDRVAVKLLGPEEVFVVFSSNFGEEHRWFQIMGWRRYLDKMEELNA